MATPLPETVKLTTRVLQHLEDLADLQGATSIYGLEHFPEEPCGEKLVGIGLQHGALLGLKWKVPLCRHFHRSTCIGVEGAMALLGVQAAIARAGC